MKRSSNARQAPIDGNSAPSNQANFSAPKVSRQRLILIAVFLLSFHFFVVASFSGWFRSSKCSPDSVANEDTIQKIRNSANRDAPRFVLYRLIGNDMPPLQCPGQLLSNTRYALMHEPELENCQKRWVLNNIINTTERGLLLDMLIEAGYTLDDIIIRRIDYKKLTKSPRSMWGSMVSAQNEGRNAAIRHGIMSGARWILPFDGNHFITKEAWESIQRSAEEADKHDYKYFKVPVHRLHVEQNSSWVYGETKFADILEYIPLMIESQLAFRYDATERFLSGMVYGLQNKLELLARACGSPKDKNYVERCVCSDLGIEGQVHKSNVTLAKQCGYSLRLWFYPCNGTEPEKVFNNGLYRQRVRRDSRNELLRRIQRVMSEKQMRI